MGRDHVCWVLEEEGALFSGDNVLGAGTVIVPADGGDMRSYLDSLSLLRDATLAWRTIYPGHGPPIADGKRAVAEYIDHRLSRETQILRELGDVKGHYSAGELVGRMYRDRVLGPELRAAATCVHRARRPSGSDVCRAQTEGVALR